MVTYTCDGCGQVIPEDGLRYTVTVDVRAAYGELEVSLMDLVRDHRREMVTLINRLKRSTPKEIEETVYKGIKLDLCPACQRAYIKNPLRFHPEQGIESDDINIDAFLKSLGYGDPSEGERSSGK